MRLKLRNLGRIASADLDLRPLTVFVGPNGTNKSWAAYAAYGALGGAAYDQILAGGYGDADQTAPVEEVVARARRALEAPDGRLDLVLRRTDLGWARYGMRSAPTELAALLGVSPTVLVGASAWLDVGAEPSLFESMVVSLQKVGDVIEGTVEHHGPRGAARRSVASPSSDLERLLRTHIRMLGVCQRWRTDAFPVERPVLLPATSLHDLVADELQAPAQDFVRLVQQARRRGAQGLGHGDSELTALLHQVFGGELVVQRDGALEFTANAVTLPLHASASMVRSLAGLSLYLQHLARPGDALVIDEPEMNVHPRAQLALMELFAVMVNRGYRLLFTTHSPYLLDHLANLLEGHRLTADARARVAGRFQLGHADAFLSPENVSVYEFREVDASRVEVHHVLDRNARVIDTRTFAEWTDRLGDLLNIVLDEEPAP